MTVPNKKSLRCVIYTRKSSEEGLEQDFNSLEAQREACEAYIKSQSHEGWRLVADRFDDGGFSGGTLERPALQRLQDKIREKRVDVIVIYKIDRLTRSLMDFAKLAELFEQEGVSFVSVTQQFNTTTSMGRLMLNVLLSFAQFEREITGERIRDKIAASKKKGMWMGGNVPIGYDAKERALVVNETEAKTVRQLFKLYLDLGNVRSVWAEAGRLGLRTKVRERPDGSKSGGKKFFPANIYNLLKCPIYIGRIHHKGETYPGNHSPIIDQQTWDAVQAQLSRNRKDHRSYPNAKYPSPLAGLLFDSRGTRFRPTHTRKGNKRYRYYVDPALTNGVTPATANLPRIPAIEIEHVVRTGVADFLTDATKVLAALDPLDCASVESALENARRLEANLRAATPSSWMPLVRPAFRQIVVEADMVKLRLVREGIRQILACHTNESARVTADGDDEKHQNEVYEYIIPAEIRMRAGVMKLIVGNGKDGTTTKADPTLIKTIARAHQWVCQLTTGRVNSIREIARAEGITESYVARVLRLGFLSPAIVEKILEGRQSVELTTDRLILRTNISLLWADQTTQFISARDRDQPTKWHRLG